MTIKSIERVINYELPGEDFQDYVHRIGRTGATGQADSMFSDGDRRLGRGAHMAAVLVANRGTNTVEVGASAGADYEGGWSGSLPGAR
ncbi:hypothetical protein T484DRAFT_1820246 [Baffinella frigidus]|nr:hypothetical protein T484DRAFT_1820246 [Cryptophyta sp. CCMP2293]